jgi:hypothetical protein
MSAIFALPAAPPSTDINAWSRRMANRGRVAIAVGWGIAIAVSWRVAVAVGGSVAITIGRVAVTIAIVVTIS